MAGCGKSELDKESARMMSMYGENLPLPARDSTASYSVKTYNGYYIGKAEDSVLSYKGIPYAQPPVGRPLAFTGAGTGKQRCVAGILFRQIGHTEQGLRLSGVIISAERGLPDTERMDRTERQCIPWQ